MSLDAFVARLDRAGIEVGVIRGPNEMVADIAAAYPGRFIAARQPQPA